MLEQIRNENHSERNQTVGMLRKWLESGTASWSILVNTLRSPSVDNHHLADKIARLHHSKCNYMSHYKYSLNVHIVKFVVFN